MLLVIFSIFLLFVGALLIMSVLYNRTLRSKPDGLVQCDICDQRCRPDGWHLKPIQFPESYMQQRRHNVHLYRKHAKAEIIQGNYFEQQEKKRLRELESMINEIENIPVGDAFLHELDKYQKRDNM